MTSYLLLVTFACYFGKQHPTVALGGDWMKYSNSSLYCLILNKLHSPFEPHFLSEKMGDTNSLFSHQTMSSWRARALPSVAPTLPWTSHPIHTPHLSAELPSCWMNHGSHSNITSNVMSSAYMGSFCHSQSLNSLVEEASGAGN